MENKNSLWCDLRYPRYHHVQPLHYHDGAFWKLRVGKIWKANRWKIFQSFLKANRWKIFESKTLAKFWKLFEGSVKILQWLRYVSDEFLCIFARKSWDLLMKASHKEKYIDAGQKKNCYFADPLPVYLLITVKTNARVNTRECKMLPTNRAMTSDCRRKSLTQFGGWKKPSHYWRGTLKFTNC